jgi:hypothetical protein
MTYLGRMSSLGDIYQRALGYKTMIIGETTMQTDLFRLINAYSMLVPTFCQVTSTVGRYFKEDYPCYQNLYKIMRGELGMGYNYLKYISNHFLTSYQQIDPSLVTYFTDMIKDIELLCDQLEDLFLNKYFKSEKMGKRLYFKEEDVQELRYFLDSVREKEDCKS